MNFLSPWTIAVAAGLTIPPLIALYFLKLRRRVQPISSTLLWKKAIEDLHVNAPFQRLRSSLLLLLQLLILVLAALALGEPSFFAKKTHKDTVIMLIDQSASMNVVEADRRTRLNIATDEAKKLIDTLPDGARIMVIAFCDRATVVSSFDTNKDEVKRKIGNIEATESLSTLNEAIALAEAYSQQLIIGGGAPGTDVGVPEGTVPPASTFIFTDGRIQDATSLRVERLDAQNIEVINVGRRGDNVGIVSMEARRNYETPELVEVFASVRNFGDQVVWVDATLEVDGQIPPGGVQTVQLGPTQLKDTVPATQAAATGEDADTPPPAATATPSGAPPTDDSIRQVAWGGVRHEGAGVIEVKLKTSDALGVDDRAWAVVPPPRNLDVLLVTEGNWRLEQVMRLLPLKLTKMDPDEYESAPDDALADGPRSRFDLVMFDAHSTARLYDGNYFFWGGVPKIEGCEAAGRVENEIIFNWDDAHPVLRHVTVEAIEPYEWLRLNLPKDAVRIMDGKDSPVLAHLVRGARSYMICAFSLIVSDPDSGEPSLNVWWAFKDPTFAVFLQNVVQYLSGAVTTRSQTAIRPGEPVTIPVPPKTRTVTVRRPDNGRDEIPTGGATQVHYAKTRQVGVYRAAPAVNDEELFAVNLFDATESQVAPNPTLVLGGQKLKTAEGTHSVNQPIWQWLLIALLVVLLLEWVIYNQRVFV